MKEILIACVGGIVTGIPTIVATVMSNRKTSALTIYRIEQLEKKVEKHNSVVERTGILETEVKDIKEDINELKKRGEI